MLYRLACIILASLPLTAAAADIIYLTDGRTFRGEISEYINGVVRFSTSAGDDSVVAMSLVAKIEFNSPASADTQTLTIPPPPVYEKELKALIERTEKRLETENSNSAAVVMYLDHTDSGEPTISQGEAEYRCYHGAGYSGIEQAHIGVAWMRLESVGKHEDGVRRVEIDPGPPYAIVSRSVTLVPGKVTNLGRILLRKVIADKPVSLSGYVRDGDGAPVEGALVSAGARRTRTDADGFYQLDGFGLENVNLSARKKGYVSGMSQVSIRDSQKAEIACDLSVFRPLRLKLAYVISAEGSDSFDGPGVESGVIERTINSPRIPLAESTYSSKLFQRFAKEGHLYFGVKDGLVTISNSHSPIFYQLVESDVDFDDIQGAGELPMSAQRCPPLSKGAMVIARGFRPEMPRGVTPFCVKFRVDELSLTTTQSGEHDATPAEGP